MSFPKPLVMAQKMVLGALQGGDVAVDATLGNGHDALMMAKAVGRKGVVYGFDIQEGAVEASRRRLLDAGVGEDLIRFFCVGHERMAEFVEGRVGAVMFNLGFLPGGEASVITRMESTLPALEAACGLLRNRGVMTVMCYPKHDGGDVEAEAVVRWAGDLPEKDWRVVRYGYLNEGSDSPFLIGVKRVS